jgi:hypothetical protein
MASTWSRSKRRTFGQVDVLHFHLRQQRRLHHLVDGALRVHDGADVDALLHDDRQERVAQHLTRGLHGHRAEPGDLARLAGPGRASPERIGVDQHDHLGIGVAAPALPRRRCALLRIEPAHQSVERDCVGRLSPPGPARLLERGLPVGRERGAEAGDDGGGPRHLDATGAIGVLPDPHRPPLAHALGALLVVARRVQHLCAPLLRLPERLVPGGVEQLVRRRGVGRRRRGDLPGLCLAQRAAPHRGFDGGHLAERRGSVERHPGLTERHARLPGEPGGVARRAAEREQPASGRQPFDGGELPHGDPGLARGQHLGIEGVDDLVQRRPYLTEHATSHCSPPRDHVETSQGK